MECFSGSELETIHRRIGSLPCSVGIKKLMVLAEAAKQSEGDRVSQFLCLMEEEGGWVTPGISYKSSPKSQSPRKLLVYCCFEGTPIS